jgi:ATP-dependent exoDNAse (exonuclease V) beta subunit
LVVFSGIPPKRKSGNSAWFSHLKDFLGKEIKPIPYSTLSEACKKTDPPPRIIPSVPQLVSALDKLPSPPPPPRLQRIAATQRAEQLLEKKNYSSLSTSSKSAFSEELGSLGHAVLEQLALHHWQGSVSHWIETLRPHFGIQKNLATRLESPIEHTRLWMQKQTNNQTLHPEFSFLLHQKDLLIDGTIDLLAHSESSFCLFDYKFTEQPDGTLIELYRPQLEIYLQAARHAFPKHQQEKVGLIAISSNGSRFIPISIKGNAEKETP